MANSLHADPQRHADALDPCTPDSIAAAKRAQQLDRWRVFLETGVRIDDNGHFVFSVDPLAQWALGVSAAVAALKR